VALPDNKHVISDIRSVATAVLAVSTSEIIQHKDLRPYLKKDFFATPSGDMCLMMSFTLRTLHLGYILHQPKYESQK